MNRTSRALVIAVALNVILAAALLTVWWRSHRAAASETAKHDSSQMADQGSMPATDPSPDPKGTAPGEASSEPTLAPVQLS